MNQWVRGFLSAFSHWITTVSKFSLNISNSPVDPIVKAENLVFLTGSLFARSRIWVSLACKTPCSNVFSVVPIICHFYQRFEIWCSFGCPDVQHYTVVVWRRILKFSLRHQVLFAFPFGHPLLGFLYHSRYFRIHHVYRFQKFLFAEISIKPAIQSKHATNQKTIL